MSKKRVLNSFEFKERKKKYYDAVKVKIGLGDMDLIMRAAQRTINYYVKHDNYIGHHGLMSVEAQEMADAFKKIKEMLKDIKLRAAQNAEQKVLSKYDVDEYCQLDFPFINSVSD